MAAKLSSAKRLDYFVTFDFQVNYSFVFLSWVGYINLIIFFFVFSMGWLGYVGLGFSIRVRLRVWVRV